MFVVVPNELRDAIYTKVDVALEKLPIDYMEKLAIREDFYRQLLNFYDEHGHIPDFTLEPNPPAKG